MIIIILDDLKLTQLLQFEVYQHEIGVPTSESLYKHERDFLASIRMSCHSLFSVIIIISRKYCIMEMSSKIKNSVLIFLRQILTSKRSYSEWTRITHISLESNESYNLYLINCLFNTTLSISLIFFPESSSDEDSIVNEETIESTPEKEKVKDRITPQMFPPPPLSDTSSTGSPPPLHHRPRLPPPNNWADQRRQDITDISDVMQNFRPCKYLVYDQRCNTSLRCSFVY